MRFRWFWRMALTFGLLALVWQAVDGAEVIARLRTLDPLWLGLALLLLLGQTLLSAIRWRVTAARLGQSMPMGHALREYFLAQTINLTLPGGVVGDAARAVRARQGVGLEVAGQAVLFERLSGQAALVMVTLVVGGLALLVPGGITPPLPISLGLASLAALALGAGLTLSWMAARRPAIGRWREAFRWSVLHRDVAMVQVALSLGTVAANVLSFAAAAASVGLVLPLAAIFGIVPLVLFAMLVPFAIGGWGVREGAAVLLLPMIGADAEAAVTASAAFGIVFLISSLAGLALSWAIRLREGHRGKEIEPPTSAPR